MSAALLTQLGEVLGCAYHESDPKSVENNRPQLFSTTTDPEQKVDGFPARCWSTGPLGPAYTPRPRIELEVPTMMDREARELAARGQADIVRYCQMMRRVQARPARRNS